MIEKSRSSDGPTTPEPNASSDEPVLGYDAACMFQDPQLCPKEIHVTSGVIRFSCGVCRS